MDWNSFWAAVTGGILVISGHVVVHLLQRHAAAKDKQKLAEERIAALVYEVQNWFESDQHLVIEAMGGRVPPIQGGHPVYALAALILSARPDLTSTVPDLMKKSKEYFSTTRIFIPAAQPDKKPDLADRVSESANAVTTTLGKILATVCDIKK